MGVLILGSVMMAVAFVTAIGAAAFFAHQYWRLEQTSRRNQDVLVHHVTGKQPFDFQPPKQGERTSQAFNDEIEATIERKLHERIDPVLELTR